GRWPARAGRADKGTDGLVLQGVGDAKKPGGRADWAESVWGGQVSPPFCWVSAVCAIAAECAIYGGMAMGSKHFAPLGPWPLAVITVTAVATTEQLGACRAAGVGANSGRGATGLRAIARSTGTLLRIPSWLRVALALIVF